MSHGDLLLMGHDVDGLVPLEPLEDGVKPLADHRVRGRGEKVTSDGQGLEPLQCLHHGRDLREEVIVKQENLQMFVTID